MQTITEVGAQQNTMTIVMMPSEFVSIARAHFGPIEPKRGSSFSFLPHFLRRTAGHPLRGGMLAENCSSTLTKVLENKQGDLLAA